MHQFVNIFYSAISQNQNGAAETLQVHREILHRTEQNIDRTDESLTEGGKSIRSMFRRALTNKILLVSIIVLLILTIFVLLVLGFINLGRK
ncbi:MAG: hypothetical protein EZS28_048275 [Streblomastix strix]|uniref:t-SNARE coiled-coil homology domain-containing protein n=1 Tax=Streblomastix strix TaxID=222440 RepID=A0A5J4TD90_9EUKA|nr:MAG: hypothetical protein EZS28_048275 [Streblomastix strix]